MDWSKRNNKSDMKLEFGWLRPETTCHRPRLLTHISLAINTQEFSLLLYMPMLLQVCNVRDAILLLHVHGFCMTGFPSLVTFLHTSYHSTDIGNRPIVDLRYY